jgi:hypothetical protein
MLTMDRRFALPGIAFIWKAREKLRHHGEMTFEQGRRGL